MLFWVSISLLAAGVTVLVTRPLFAPPPQASEDAAADREVYKDQLQEIDADRARGLISDKEAEGARNEVARRLIRSGATRGDSGRMRLAEGSLRRLSMAATAAIPVLGLGLYLTFGRPELPGQPLKARLAAAPEKSSANDLVAQVEERLRQHPEDGKGWDVIAPVYMSLGRFEDAAEAYGKAAAILGETAKRLDGFAIAAIRAGDGNVTEAARKALQRSLEIEPKRFEPRYWLAIAAAQEGKTSEAIAQLKSIVADSPPEAPWRKSIAADVAQLEAKASGKESTAAAAAPDTPAGAGALAGLDDDQRAKIEQMVSGLAGRLKQNGNDLEGWLRLIKAYKVMQRESEAVGALAEARKIFAGDEKALAEIGQLAKLLGLGS